MRLGTVSHPRLHKWAVVECFTGHTVCSIGLKEEACVHKCVQCLAGAQTHRLDPYTKQHSQRGKLPHALEAQVQLCCLSFSTKKKRTKQEQNLTLWHANKHWGMHQWWPFFPFFSASLYNSFLQSYKANTVVAEIRVNTGCCDVCVVSDWPYAVDIPDI